MKSFPHYKQLDTMDCGPTCIRMIAKYYGKRFSLQKLRERSSIGRDGVSLLGISDAAESLGFRTLSAKIPFDKMVEEAPMPLIAHWQQNHFIVVYDYRKGKVHVADPDKGIIKFTKEEFLRGWKANANEEGIVLLMEPSPAFYEEEDDKVSYKGFGFLLGYLWQYKKFVIQVFLGLLVGSLLQLIFPFLTQALVDQGIANQNLGFIYTVLAAQMMLFISRTSVEVIRSWILLHLGTRININILSDFLIKLMKLPISFFNQKMIGDIMQRIGDHQRISAFLTGNSLTILFSFLNFIVFGVVLLIYSSTIFGLFLAGTSLYVIWVVLFMKKRRELDNKRFAELSNNQNSLYQLIVGMPEIKLNNCEKQKRWEWEHIQALLFKLSVKSLSLNQYQTAGASFINELKNILITFIAAKLVLEGELTLGMMLAITYILGQLDGPINQFIGFIQSAQDAKISLERMGEIHDLEEETRPSGDQLMHVDRSADIRLDRVFFRYGGRNSPWVLEDISLTIPAGKTTAIVGMSGSGKTTLLKLLLKFYPVEQGEVWVGDARLDNIDNAEWRRNCGVVMQDGFIFSDTIAHNIAISDELMDFNRVKEASEIANIRDVIEQLPLGYNTKVGQEGVGLSQGQKQRILIARAAYKNPQFIYFDEATNALDAKNERVIMQKLDEFFKGKTAIVVAHRLSTVKNADQIVVMDKGKIMEIGTHKELVAKQGYYFNLVKNQLELDA
ncbi:peptidase domain-containing ABC transporter [Luteibaculum oceani]|uniref:Peptidase domain-containing ABC transporter n=1 Tax=Luteibaculum oceani TaxID=1294296 RepID=A0A5C6VJ06_9FLAO|nr:peptidase domain-containing ABC transporter [Luteibaculum oceani]TXC85473.1 peptidase domain-containing ABC transporter [Luteibaculum oceani]